MRINLAKQAGFCFGVKRALRIALNTVGRGAKVYMLGDIVHNEEVVKEIELAGIKKIKMLGKGKDKTLLIRAHGAPNSTIKKALKCGYRIIDATCPMVKEIHKIARDMERKGYRIIVIGDKNHDEVHGIIGQLNLPGPKSRDESRAEKAQFHSSHGLPAQFAFIQRDPASREKPGDFCEGLKGKAIVIDDPRHIPLRTIKKLKKACVVVQSTQNLHNVLKIVGSLKPYIRELKFFNTICQPTRMKQEEVRKMPKENDIMIIIGSRTSANTRRLYEISKAINKRTYWISSEKDIQPRWLENAENVGITAGASTPESTTNSIIKHIKRAHSS